MNKSKKNSFLKIAGIMTAVTMMSTCVVAGTLAKYTSSANKEGLTAGKAATWDIDVGNGTAGTADLTGYLFGDLTFSISELTTDGAVNGSYQDGTIVPGTFGYATLTVENKGEVDAVLSITKSGVATSHQGLKLVITDTQPTAETATSIADMDNLNTISLVKANGKKTIYIAYCWEFDDANDHNDTDIQGQDISFGDITITASQAKAE